MEYVKVVINAQSTADCEEMFNANLPQEISLQELHKTLKLAIDIHIAGSGTKQRKGGSWRYQLLSRDLKRVINKTSVQLKTDDDYRTLVKKTKGHGERTPIAVLTQEKDKSPDAACEAVGNEHSDYGHVNAENEFDGFEFGYESKNKSLEKDDGVWDDSNWEEPVDKNGKPYFDSNDPANVDRVYTKYGEGYEGPIDAGNWMETLSMR